MYFGPSLWAPHSGQIRMSCWITHMAIGVLWGCWYRSRQVGYADLSVNILYGLLSRVIFRMMSVAWRFEEVICYLDDCKALISSVVIGNACLLKLSC